MNKTCIALRYCGGCNPRYDRSGLVARVVEQFSEMKFASYTDRQTFTGILVVCGCTAQCASQEDLPPNLPRFVVKDGADLGDLLSFLESLDKE